MPKGHENEKQNIHFFSVSVSIFFLFPSLASSPTLGLAVGNRGPEPCIFRFRTVFIPFSCVLACWMAGCQLAACHLKAGGHISIFCLFSAPFFCFRPPIFLFVFTCFRAAGNAKNGKIENQKMKKTFRAFALGHFQFASTTVPSRHDNTTPSHRVSNREGRSNDFKQALTSLKA